MIVALLTETTYLPVSRVGRAYRRYLSGFKTAPEAMIRQAYGQEANTMRDLMVRAIGASMAFLVKASDFVSMAGDSPCDCGPGASRFAQDASGKLVTAHDGLCHACGRGAFAQMPGWADGACVAACPPDRPTVQDGKCVAVGACPDSTPFVEAGRCVAWCSGNKVVVNNRSCEDRCPAPQQADDAGFCRVLPAPAPRRCRETADDVARACCSRVGAPASTAAECCSGDRRPDGFCRGLAGEPCVIDGDCVSLTCTGHRCAPPENGGRCLKDGECASGLCAEEHVCLGLAGDPCTSAAVCDSRVCVGGRCGAGP
jgi:hypothetical protein